MAIGGIQFGNSADTSWLSLRGAEADKGASVAQDDRLFDFGGSNEEETAAVTAWGGSDINAINGIQQEDTAGQLASGGLCYSC